nr:reverse transcriptase domain-containing protein [Tanacetum cinerariifolium]
MASSSESRTLPGNIVTNPKEDLKGITTRSGVTYNGPTIPTSSKVVKHGTEVTKDQVQTPCPQSTTHVQPPVTQSKNLVSEPIAAPANEQNKKFYEIFKDMSFEISFMDALILMPKFTSTLKALIRNKKKLSEMARTSMNEHCSAVILNKLPKKHGDLGKFLIPCELPRMDECLALADLGASINLMPLSVWKELALPELTPTCMTLEFTDCSVSKPIGIVKDVSIKVCMFYFPADFVVVDFEPDPRVPLILRRCFLKTGCALIDMHKGELTLRIRNEAITYNLDQTSRYSANYDQITATKINVTDEACEEYFQEVLGFSDVTASGSPTPSDDPILSTTSPTLTPFGDSDFLLFEEANAFLAILNSNLAPSLPNHEQSVPSFTNELKACEAKAIKSSVDEPPKVEIKDLPPHLEYAFLEGDNKLPEDQFEEDPPEVLKADNRTMTQFLQAPTMGYEDAIVILEIAATNFELKHGLINLVQNKQFFGHDKEDPHAHIRYFNKITSTMRVPNVPNLTIKLMLFPFSLEGDARIWLEKEHPRSILTWDDLVSKFINQFFPPSKMTNLRNEITRFQQRFDESFSEAWDHFNNLLRACPHHGFSELHQLDTFYNALNVNDQEVRQSRAKAVVAKVNLSSSTPAISSDVAKLKDMVKTLLLDKKNQSSAPATSHTPALVKAVESNYVTCGGSGTLPGNTVTNPKEDLKGITTRSGVAYNGPTIPTPSKVVKQGTEKPSIPYPSRRDNERRREQANKQIKKFFEIFKDMSFKISFTDALILMPKFASTLKALIGNKEKLSKMARTPMNKHCSVVILNKLPKKLRDPGKFLIPCEFPRMNECLALADLDRSVSKPIGIANDVSVKVGMFYFPADFVVVDFKPDPQVPLILRRCFLKTGRALIDVDKGELTLRIGHEAITYNLDQTSRYSANYDQMTANKINVTDEACEEYFQEVLSFFDVTASGSPTPSDDPIVSTTSPMLTPFGDSDFLLFEEANAFLGLEDDPDSPKLDPSYYDPKGDIQMLKAILNSDLAPSLPDHEQSVPSFTNELKACEAKTIKSSVDEPPEVMRKYGVTHRLSTAYHPQTSRQVEVSNRSLKRILERTIGQNRASWSDKLDDALWAFRTAYKTPIGCTPYKLVYGKACHLPMELEHKAYWALKQTNFGLTIAGDHRNIQLNELNKLRDQAYENSLIYKEKTKRFHDSKIKNRIFNIGDRVLLYNSRLKIFLGNLKTRWSGPFTIAKVFPYGTVELSQADGPNFKLNGHRIKHYFGGDVPQLVVLDLQNFPP